MKTKATLIKKEILAHNFKLTFLNREGRWLFLILHQHKAKIYEQLKTNLDYSFSWRQGNKKYLFVNPQSIKVVCTQAKGKNNIKDLYYTGLLNELGIKELTNCDIQGKLECLKNVRRNSQAFDDEKRVLIWIKEVIIALFMKYRELGVIVTNSTTECEQELLNQIETLFFLDKM